MGVVKYFFLSNNTKVWHYIISSGTVKIFVREQPFKFHISISEKFTTVKMVFFKNQRRLQTSCPSYSNALLLDLMSEKLTEQHNVIQLVSSGKSAYVHTIQHSLEMSVCFCAIFYLLHVCVKPMFSSCLLKASPPSTLENLVTMLYTGHNSTGLSRDQARHVIEIAKGLDLDITIEVIDSDINNYDNIDADQDSSLIFCTDSDADREEQNDQALRIKTTIVNKHGSLTLSFPESRSSRQA